MTAVAHRGRLVNSHAVTDQPNAVRPGWYPDPHVRGQMRFWDGIVWTVESYAAPNTARPVGYRFALLGRTIRTGLVLSLLLGVAEVGLYGWGLSMFDDAFAAGDLNRLSNFDDLNRVLSICDGVVFVVTGIIWVIWQYQLARSAGPNQLERSPGWHIGSWFIPFANLVMPFQNMRDLWRKFVSERTALIGWWWATTLFTNVALRFGTAGSGETTSDFKNDVSLWLASTLVGLVSAGLAIVIVRRLTAGGLARSASGPPAGRAPEPS